MPVWFAFGWLLTPLQNLDYAGYGVESATQFDNEFCCMKVIQSREHRRAQVTTTSQPSQICLRTPATNMR